MFANSWLTVQQMAMSHFISAPLEPIQENCYRTQIFQYIAGTIYTDYKQALYFSTCMDQWEWWHTTAIMWCMNQAAKTLKPLTVEINGAQVHPMTHTLHNDQETAKCPTFRSDWHLQHHPSLLVISWTLSTHWELHSFCQASWYFTGSSCRVAGSKSSESMYCSQNKVNHLESSNMSAS